VSDVPGSVRKCVQQWFDQGDHVPAERIAADTGRSIATVRRWIQVSGGSDAWEPKCSDVIVMERLKPGLISRLQRLAVGRRRPA